MQESNQRRWHRGGADREAYRDCVYQPPCFPGFEPPSPVHPFRHLSGHLLWLEQSKSNRRSLILTHLRIDKKSNPHQSIDRGRVGGLGEGGSKSGCGCRFMSAVKKDFAVSASPSRILLVLFLPGQEKYIGFTIMYRKREKPRRVPRFVTLSSLRSVHPPRYPGKD